MPIQPDGTITPVLQRYVTRVVLEFTYDAYSAERAQEEHDSIIDSLVYGASVLDEFLAHDGGRPETAVSNAKSPQLLPEGEEAEGGSDAAG